VFNDDTQYLFAVPTFYRFTCEGVYTVTSFEAILDAVEETLYRVVREW